MDDFGRYFRPGVYGYYLTARTPRIFPYLSIPVRRPLRIDKSFLDVHTDDFLKFAFLKLDTQSAKVFLDAGTVSGSWDRYVPFAQQESQRHLRRRGISPAGKFDQGSIILDSASRQWVITSHSDTLLTAKLSKPPVLQVNMQFDLVCRYRPVTEYPARLAQQCNREIRDTDFSSKSQLPCSRNLLEINR